MSAEAVRVREPRENRLTLAAAVATGEVYQLPNGRAAVYTGLTGQSADERANFDDEGQFTVQKTASQVWLDGDPIWWDRSAGTATCLEPLGSSDRDFYLGTAVGDASSSATTGVVDLNKHPSWIIDSTRDNGDTVVVKTVVGSTTVEVPNLRQQGGMLVGNFGTTAEAQKVDWLSNRGFALGAKWILEALFEVDVDADAAAADISIGVANGTHASDADSITESVFFHLDGASANINCESDDGTTEVPATDSTIDYVVGTPIRLKLDGRSSSDVKFYINGAEVLNGTANLGNIAAATGPLKALFHMEKSADDSPGTYKIRLRVRTMEQDAAGN